jgi:hypothetical protein
MRDRSLPDHSAAMLTAEPYDRRLTNLKEVAYARNGAADDGGRSVAGGTGRP